MSFVPEKLGYEDKRKFRYELQDYMHDAFRFDDFPGKLVLEIGCGAGIDSAEFARNGAKVASTDLTRAGTELTRDLLKESGLPSAVIQSDAKTLPFKNEAFDCVYSFGVLHHIPDVETALAEIHRVLKPGGRLMVMLYHRDSLLYAYSIIYWRGIRMGCWGLLRQSNSCLAIRKEMKVALIRGLIPKMRLQASSQPGSSKSPQKCTIMSSTFPSKGRLR